MKFLTNVVKRGVAAILIPAVAGCGVLNPHLRAPELADPVRSAAAAPFAGDIEDGIRAANLQRDLYYNAVGNHAAMRNVDALFLIPLSAWIVYKGVTTDSVSARRNLALGTAAAGTGYALFSWFTNRPGETAYVEGFKAISCAIWRSRPYLIPQDEFKEWWGDQVNGANGLGEAVRSLDIQINKIEISQNLLEERGAPKEMLENLNAELAAARRARQIGEKKVIQAAALRARVETAGFVLKKRVDLIVGAVSAELQRTEPRLDQLQSLVGSISAQVSRNVDALRPDSLNLRDINEFKEKAGAAGGQNAGAPAAVVAAPDKAQPPRAPGQLIDKSIDEINKAVAGLQRSGKNADARNALAIKQLKGEIEKLRSQANSPAAAAQVSQVGEDARQALAKAKAVVYQRRNMVDQMFERVYRLHVSNKALEQCQSNGTTLLTVNPPDEEQSLAANGNLSFTISGGEGVPRVYLSGQNGAGESEVALSMAVKEGSVVASLKALEKVPSGPLYLLITDGSGKQRENVRINIEQPKPKPNPKPAADSSDGKK